MYTSTILSQDQALCHLFFHCCLRDDKFTSPEMDDLSGKLVALGLQPKINIKEELIAYRNTKPMITDEEAYLRSLIQTIMPVNELALYSYCVELCIDDPSLDPREEALLDHLEVLLNLEPGTAPIVQKLMAQRKAVEIQKIF